MPKCHTCRFWEGAEEHWGTCHRFPPTLREGRTDDPLWPETAPKDWCGEWRAIGEDADA